MDVTLAIEAAGSWQAINQSEGPAWSQDKAWLELGSAVLTNASAIIRHQYLYGWRSNVFHPDLAILRQLCRDLCAALPIESSRPLLLKQGAFWQEGPVDAMATLRQTWARDPASYATGIVRDPYEPFWVGWSPRDREVGVKQWAGFISELQSSTNRLDRAFGSMLKLATERFDPQIAMAHEEFLDATMDEKHSRFSTEIDFSVLDAFGSLLTNRYSSPVTLRRTRLLNQWKSLDFARVKHYLQVARTHDVNRAGWRLAKRFFSQEEARELLPIVDEYIKRVGGDWMQAVRSHLVELSSKATDERERLLADPVFDPVRFRRLFVEHEFTEAEAQRFAMPLRIYANKMNWSNELGKVDGRLQAIVASANARSKTNAPASPKPGEALRITRQFRPLYRDQRGESLPTSLGPWLEHQGKIITVINHPQKGFSWPEPGDGAHVAILDPMTGTCQMLPQAINTERFQAFKFRVLGNQFYWISGESSLSVFSLDSAAEPREVKLDLPVWSADLIALQDRLFLATKDYIAEFLPHDGSLKLLASKRRKPAANQLDDWAGWTAGPRLWLTEGTLFANVGGTNVWILSSTGPWSLREADTGHQRFPFSLSYVANFSQCFDERVWIDGCREVLLSPELTQLPYWPMPLDYPLTPGRSSGGSTTHAFDGTNLWVLLPTKKLRVEQTRTSMTDGEDRDVTLLWFNPDYEMPSQVPLVFPESNPRARYSNLLCTRIEAGLVFGSTRPVTAEYSLPVGTGESAWFVPLSELADWVATRQPLTQRLARSQPERRQFDLNKDGRLDADELRAMQTNSAWMDKRERFETERMLLTFDADRDSTLDLEEWKALKTGGAELGFITPSPTPSGNAFGPGRTLGGTGTFTQYDHDADSRLSQEELRAYYRQPSSAPVATVPVGRPGGSFGRPAGADARPRGLFGTPTEADMAALFARYDKNKNGKLDPQERHEMQPPHIRPFDRDTNGILSSAEFEEYRKSASARRNAGRQQRPGASTGSPGVIGK
jgi:Ca2+-binding EF-hand superfamily protein